MPFDLNGTHWKNIPEKCDPIDGLLQAQGVGFIKRKLANSLSSDVVLHIHQDEQKMKIVQEGIKTREEEFHFDWDGHKTNGDLGPESWKVFWEDDVLVNEITLANGVRTVRRSLEGDKELKFVIHWKGKDGQEVTVKRHFRKVVPRQQ